MWAVLQSHTATGCLHAIMSVLHPEFNHFVRCCMREYVLKWLTVRHAMTSARDLKVERQVTALLDQKLISGADAADFDAYLRFADHNWHH